MELKRCGLDLRELDRKNNNGTANTRDEKGTGREEGEQHERTWQREEPGSQEHRQLDLHRPVSTRAGYDHTGRAGRDGSASSPSS